MMPPPSQIYPPQPQNLMNQQQYMGGMPQQMQPALMTPPIQQQNYNLNQMAFQQAVPEQPQLGSDGFHYPPTSQQVPSQLPTPPSFQPLPPAPAPQSQVAQQDERPSMVNKTQERTGGLM